MSSQKEKLMAEAQRLVLRGQVDKAVKAYEQLLTLDPGAIAQRQKLGELLVKAGRSNDARTHYEAIGRHYASHGFYLKAIAVYRKLQVMFPGDVDITFALAGLNEKHGLVANALVEYKKVYDYHEQQGNHDEALKILDRMQRVDPRNVGIKLKLAEAYCTAGKRDDGYAVFLRAGLQLQEQGDTASFFRLAARVRQVFPEKEGYLLEVLSEQVSSGEPGHAVKSLQQLLRNNPRDSRVWSLIIEAYRRLGQNERVKLACQHFLSFFPADMTALKEMLACLIAEKNVRAAVAFLDKNEGLFQQKALDNLVESYRALERLDPVNLRIAEGLKRTLEAAGHQDELNELSHRISALQSVAGGGAGRPSAPVQPEKAEAAVEPQGFLESVFGIELPIGGVAGRERMPEPEPPVSQTIVPPQAEPDEDEIEIEVEVEVEDESDHSPIAADGASDGAVAEWGSDILEAVPDAPRSVRFGNDLDTTDAQAHYDLGVAFREMGLYDEAVNEFRQAARAPERRVECLVLQGACLRDRGDAATAEQQLRSLLKPGLGLEQSCLVKYELSLACQALGKSEESAALLAEIDTALPGFRDVRSRLDKAEQNESPLEFSDEELAGFDLK